MSTLKVTHLQNENGTGPAMSIAVGGGVTFAGITTFHGNVDLGSNSLSGDLTGSVTVATGATISGSTNTITASTNGSERLRITSGGNVNIGGNFTETSHPLNISDSTKPSLCLHTGTTQRADFSATTGITSIRSFANSPFTINIGGSGETEAFRITAGGNVGINTNAPDKKLTVFTDSNSGYSTETNNTPSGQSLIKLFNKNGTDNTGVDNYSAIEFGVANGATSQGWLGYTRTGNNQGAFFVKQRNASSSYPETIRFPSSGGVTFGGGANDANTLDDYEEGTFSPNLQDTGTPGATYTSQNLNYIKTGKMVMITGRVQCTRTGTGSGVLQFQLPFVADNNISGASSPWMSHGNCFVHAIGIPGDGTGQFFWEINSTTHAGLFYQRNNQSWTSVPTGQIPTSGQGYLTFTMTYRAAA